MFLFGVSVYLSFIELQFQSAGQRTARGIAPIVLLALSVSSKAAVNNVTTSDKSHNIRRMSQYVTNVAISADCTETHA